MKLKYFVAFCASAILLMAGCNGAPSVETGKIAAAGECGDAGDDRR